MTEPLYGSMPAAMQSAYSRDPRLLYARNLMQQGSSTAPVQSWVEGLARMLQGGLGGYFAGKAEDDWRGQSQEYTDTMKRAAEAGAGENPDPRAVATILAGNRWTAPKALEMQVESAQKAADRQASFDNQVKLKQMPLTAEQLQQRIQERAAGRSVTNVSVNGKEESEFAKETGRLQAKNAETINEAGRNAMSMKQRIAEFRNAAKALKDAGGNTGALAPWMQTATGVLQAFGVDPQVVGLPQSAGPGEALQAVMNEFVTGKLGAGGFPSQNFSNADMQFMLTTIPQLRNRPEANEAIASIAERVADRQIEMASAWRAARGKGMSYDDFLDQWTRHVEANPVFSRGVAPPVQQATPSGPDGGLHNGRSKFGPPVTGAKQAPDGKWYVPDPNRPGKYLQVVE